MSANKSSYLLKSTSTAVALIAAWVLSATALNAQTNVEHPKRFPYTFTNFVWWTNPELRAALAKRLPGLENEIAPESATEARMRVALSQMLKEKGIRAEVQTEEPPFYANSSERDPHAPPTAILFRVLSPPDVLIDKVTLDDCPPVARSALEEIASHLSGKPYAANTFWSDQERMSQHLEENGYLEASVIFRPGTPRQENNRYLVPLEILIKAGPQYHVSSVKADGGPILQDKDLSPYFTLKAGDIATPYAFGKLIGAIRSVYWQQGYADVKFHTEPVLDQARALASYDLEVVPGPLYHLRALKIENLDPERQSQVRTLLGLKSGDVYDAYAVTMLNSKLRGAGPSMLGLGFTFNPKEDQQGQLIDLTLTFYKE